MDPRLEIPETNRKHRMLHRPFHSIGKRAMAGINHLGASTIFLGKALVMMFKPKGVSRIVRQIYYIGTQSTGVVMMVGLFTGMVLGLQMFYALIKYGSESALGSAVALSLIRELGPVLTAIMITARAGSAMTAEIGIQRISEQIDALYTMGIDPIQYLVSPRIAASLVSFPLLTAFFDLVGLIGGYLTGVVLLKVNAGAYLYRVQWSIEMQDITAGFVKALVFSIIVSNICCYQGYFCHLGRNRFGARSVGRATTSAVVLSCVTVLAADYVVTSFLM